MKTAEELKAAVDLCVAQCGNEIRLRNAVTDLMQSIILLEPGWTDEEARQVIRDAMQAILVRKSAFAEVSPAPR